MTRGQKKRQTLDDSQGSHNVFRFTCQFEYSWWASGGHSKAQERFFFCINFSSYLISFLKLLVEQYGVEKLLSYLLSWIVFMIYWNGVRKFAFLWQLSRGNWISRNVFSKSKVTFYIQKKIHPKFIPKTRHMTLKKKNLIHQKAL